MPYLSAEEVGRLLGATVCLEHLAALSVAYGAGLRVAEVAALKVSDDDSTRMLLRVERSNGGRDRSAMLSADLLGLLRCWWTEGHRQGVLHREAGCSPARTGPGRSARVSFTASWWRRPGRASLWATTAEPARGEAFNYVHEPFRWRRIWERVAEALDLQTGPPMPLNLARYMPAHAAAGGRTKPDRAALRAGRRVGLRRLRVQRGLRRGLRHGQDSPRRLHRNGR